MWPSQFDTESQNKTWKCGSTCELCVIVPSEWSKGFASTLSLFNLFSNTKLVHKVHFSTSLAQYSSEHRTSHCAEMQERNLMPQHHPCPRWQQQTGLQFQPITPTNRVQSADESHVAIRAHELLNSPSTLCLKELTNATAASARRTLIWAAAIKGARIIALSTRVGREMSISVKPGWLGLTGTRHGRREESLGWSGGSFGCDWHD